ncbi:MAG: hypothetical protein A4E28_02764 [Methanocella sp. PtaU1.Bin125]|nr:MAG: hypothetical protein A4E28_02764 [Methanocella sp. PtaU1.Bin125]
MPTKQEVLEHTTGNINAIIAKMLADEEQLEKDVRYLEHYSDVFLIMMKMDEDTREKTSAMWKKEIHDIYEPLMDLRRRVLIVKDRFWVSGEKAHDYTKDKAD